MVGFFARVDAHVALECLEVAEVGATDHTGVRLLPGVDQHVSAEVGHLGRNQVHTYVNDLIQSLLIKKIELLSQIITLGLLRNCTKGESKSMICQNN